MTRIAAVVRRTWVGGALALAVAGLFWFAYSTSNRDVALYVGTTLSALAVLEVSRMGRLRGWGLGWPLAVAGLVLFGLNYGITREWRCINAPHVPVFAASELVCLYFAVVLATSAAFLEQRFSPLRRPWATAALAVIFVVRETWGADRTLVPDLDWSRAGILGLVSAGLVLLANRGSKGAGGGSPRAHLAAALWLLFPLPAMTHIWWNHGFEGLLALVILSKVGDIAGYYVGNAFGRRHPFPNLSPGKTVEGCVGSLAVGTLAGGLFVTVGLLPDSPYGFPGGLLAGLFVNLAAQAGDLLESGVKRRAGVKDSGRTFGPSGGVLDLVDSLLLTVPVALVVWPLIFS